MTSKQWEKLIKKQLSRLGQTEEAYNSVVSTLADILESYHKKIEGLDLYKGAAYK